MLRTMKRLMALSLGMALPVEAHLNTTTSDVGVAVRNRVFRQEVTDRGGDGSPDTLDVSASVFIPSVVAPFHSHFVV
jgi:hypothetical protein